MASHTPAPKDDSVFAKLDRLTQNLDRYHAEVQRLAALTQAAATFAPAAAVAAPSPFAWAPGEDTRPSLLPIRHHDIWAFRKKLEALHWVAQEVDLTKDKKDWDERLSADERHFVALQLGFFVGADVWVLANLAENFSEEFDCLEAKMTFAAQADQECTHAESYGLQVEAVMTGAEREHTLNAAATMPAVAKMRDWAFRWFDRAIPMGERLVAWAIFEGVLFSASFASLQWLREKNLLPGITEYNMMIVRDESVHTLHTCLYVRKYLRVRPGFERVKAIFESAVATLDDFVAESLPVRLIGMNSDLMKQYVRFQCDCVLAEMGYTAKTGHAPLFGVKNPFPMMDKLTLNEVAKTNFFERNSTQYQNISKDGAARFAVDTSPADDDD